MNPAEREKSPLEKMNERLYAPKMRMEDIQPAARTHTTEQQIARGGWQHEALPERKIPTKIAPSVLFLGAAVVFFVVAAAVAAFLLITGGSAVSSDKVQISVNKEQPTAISSGDVVPLLIEIKNNNAVALKNISLTVGFPDGTYDPDQEGKTLTHATVLIDSIPAYGEPIHRTIRARLFGMENQQLALPISVEYKTAGSNAVFVKKENYTATISSSPIALEVKTVSEVSAGQDFTIVLTARSNASAPIPDVVLKTMYPPKFVANKEQNPKDTNSIIPIGTIAPGESKEITLHGALTGNEGDENVLHFEIGTLNDLNIPTKFVSYIEKTASVFLTKPFLKIGLSLNRTDADTVVVPAGSEVSGTLSIGNTLSDPIQNGAVVLKLKGDIIDTNTIQVTNGFYDSGDHSIRFTKETVSGLATLNPGESVNGTFTFRIKEASAIANQSGPSALISVSATGNRSTAGNVSEALTSTLTRTIQIQSALRFDAKLTHSNGPFKNSGTVPPTAGAETLYTVQLQVQNGANGIAKGVATMVLPSYVRFTGSTSPADGSLSYNETTRTVTWNAGDIVANATPQAAFQIALLPSTSQRGTSPMVVGGISFSGFDRFVQKDLHISTGNLDTRTAGDAGYTISSSQVQ